MAAARSPFASQLFSEVVPLRGVLLGLFFTAVGMFFDPVALAGHVPSLRRSAGSYRCGPPVRKH